MNHLIWRAQVEFATLVQILVAKGWSFEHKWVDEKWGSDDMVWKLGDRVETIGSMEDLERLVGRLDREENPDPYWGEER